MTDPVPAIDAGRAAMVELPRAGPMTATMVPLSTRPDPAHTGIGAMSSTLGRVSDRLFNVSSGGPAAMLAQVDRAAMQSFSGNDLLRSSLVATDLSIHVSMAMLKFNLSSSLGSAATGLFNTLLKNRE